MTIWIKKDGAYSQESADFLKAVGVYGEASIYAKVSGAYQQVDQIPIQPETTALIARMTTPPSDTEAAAINRLVYDMKVAGIWTQLDCFYAITSQSSQSGYLNWIQDAFNLSATNGTFTNYYGYTVPDPNTSAFLNTTFNPTTASSPKLVRDSACIGVYNLRESGGGSGNLMGAFNGTNGLQVSPSGSSNVFRIRVNSTTALDLADVKNGQGLFVGNRSGANSIQAYKDGALVNSSDSNASAAIVNQGITIGRISTSFYSPGWPAIAFVGASLNATQQAAMYAAIMRYLAVYMSLSLSPTIATTAQTYLGGYVEIQPDSFNGGTSIPPTDGTTDIWGFPYTLTTSERARLKSLLFPGGGKGLDFLRLPLGFAYRGLRNIDGTSGLAKNVGERFAGQNSSLTDLIANVVNDGGGLAPEYWGVAPHWTTQSKFGGSSGNTNTLWAGGAYARSVTLNSIRGSDPTQYAAQIAAFTDAIVNDFEYLHQNVGPVRMYGLQNEPQYGQLEYGSCLYTDQLYSDVLAALHPKVLASSILSTWGGSPNVPKLHIGSDDTFAIGQTYITANPSTIWAYSHHNIQSIYQDADWLKGSAFATLKGSKVNVFVNETEYFDTTLRSDAWKCANNMLRDCHNMVYGNAPAKMPIIHVAKQIGASGSNSNTSGYALVEVNLNLPYGIPPGDAGNPAPSLDYQTFRPIAHNYNAHLFMGENLPIGAVRVGGTPTISVPGIGLALFTYGGKLYVFAANRNAYPVSLSVALGSSKTMFGKRYNVNEAGTAIGSKTGSTITLSMPAFSGDCWIEQ